MGYHAVPIWFRLFMATFNIDFIAKTCFSFNSFIKVPLRVVKLTRLTIKASLSVLSPNMPHNLVANDIPSRQSWITVRS